MRLPIRKEYLIVIAVIAGILAWQLIPYVVRPAVITGHWTMYEKTIDAENGIVTGYWMFALTIDTRDEIEFTFKDLVENLAPNPAEGIPPGSQVRTKATLSIIFEPKGPPYISGPIEKRGYVYCDAGLFGTDRAWQYYALAYPEWHVDGRHAPYDITVVKDGISIFGPQTYISGIREGWDTGTNISLPYGIEVRQFGQLTNGLVIPTDRYAYIWTSTDINNPPSTHLVKLDELERIIDTTCPDGWIKGGFYDPADKWDEACEGDEGPGGLGAYPGLGIIERSTGTLTMSEFPYILSDFLEPVYYPTGILRFTESIPTLYHDTVPTKESVGWGSIHIGEFGSEATQYYAIRALPQASVMATLILKVPASLFDSWVYRPPYGIPKVVGIVTPAAIDGQRNIISFDVRNDGPTGDTFVAELSYPDVQIQQSPGRVYIRENQIGRFQFIISRPRTEAEEYTLSGSVKITALGSGMTDTASFTQEWHGGGGPVQGSGSIMGTVVDEHLVPIDRARVYCGGKVAFTDQTGMFSITDIAAGSQRLTIDAGNLGYDVLNTDVTVVKDQMTDVGTFVLQKIGAISGWVWVAVAVVIIAIVIGALYYYYKKRRRK